MESLFDSKKIACLSGVPEKDIIFILARCMPDHFAETVTRSLLTPFREVFNSDKLTQPVTLTPGSLVLLFLGVCFEFESEKGGKPLSFFRLPTLKEIETGEKDKSKTCFSECKKFLQLNSGLFILLYKNNLLAEFNPATRQSRIISRGRYCSISHNCSEDGSFSAVEKTVDGCKLSLFTAAGEEINSSFLNCETVGSFFLPDGRILVITVGYDWMIYQADLSTFNRIGTKVGGINLLYHNIHIDDKGLWCFTLEEDLQLGGVELGTSFFVPFAFPDLP